MADLDCTNALQPCNCTSSQICVQIGRSGTECARNTCVDRASSGHGASSGGGSGNSGSKSVGALAGQVVGGVLGACLIAVGLYWFWWRRRRAATRNGARPASPRKSPNPLKDFKIGSTKEKADAVTGPPGPGEEDAQPVSVQKRQSLRFDSNNNPVQNRRSLSGAHGVAALPDNPFGDHHSSIRDSVSSDNALVQSGGAGQGGSGDPRGSQATMSEFSFRSSHSTNIIPIAYIPAHASQASMADMVGPGSRRPQSSVTNATGTESMLPPPRGANRASVPVSLRSSTNDTSSLFGGAPRLSGVTDANPTFSGLFDRRMSTHGSMASPNGLEVIASTSPGAHSPPLSTPTVTKGGKPIRPPRAPGLDLKLPTPEPKSPGSLLSPPISPGFPWSSSASNAGQSPGLAPPSAGPAGGRKSPISPAANGQRETLLSVNGLQRSSAYSTFSQTTTSSGSHMSYILDPPQIVTPVSAGRVEVQQLTRGVAKAVMLGAGGSGAVSPVPAVPAQYASAVSPLPSSHQYTRNSPSPNSDNPFDDASAVRIAIPSSADNTPVLPHTPTFGQQPGDRSTVTTRRDSDLSIFTSASGNLGPFAQQQLQQAREKLSRAASSASSKNRHFGEDGAPTPTRSAEDEIILEPPQRPFANGTGGGADSRHTSAALSTRSGYASVLDGIPFNLSLSPEARHSQASSAGAGLGVSNPFRDSASSAGLPVSQSQQSGMSEAARESTASSFAGSDSDGKRDTSYSLASEWNGAFAGMPIMMGGGPRGSVGEAVPELPEEYRKKRDSAATEKDDRYSTDSLAMAAAVARSFNA